MGIKSLTNGKNESSWQLISIPCLPWPSVVGQESWDTSGKESDETSRPLEPTSGKKAES